MNCGRCGGIVGAGARFCPSCGAPFGATGVGVTGYSPVSPPQPAQPGPAQPVARQTNGLAIAGMVLGILWVWWIGSILALVFGYVAKGQIEASGGKQLGGGMAIAAIVLGWVGVGIFSLVILRMIF